MKILHVINSLKKIGGAESLLIEMLPLMKSCGHDTTVLLIDGLSQKQQELFDTLNIKTVTLNKSVYSISNLLILNTYFKKENYDIIHVHLFPSLYWIGLCSYNNPRLNLIYTEHSTSNGRRKHFFLKLVEFNIYRRYCKIACISSGVKSSLANWLPKLENKMMVIENGINTQLPQLSNLSREDVVGSNSDDFIVLMVSRFHKAKDHKTLIDAMKLLDDKTSLWLLGDGDTIESMKKYVISIGLSKRITFLGFRQDVKEIINLSDVCVLSSHWEGFGLAAIECMIMKKPLIASNIKGLADVVSDAGILFEKGNKNELANHIIKLKNDIEYYKCISLCCYERALIYDIKNTVKKYLEIYESIISK